MHFTSERLTLEQITPELARRILVRDEQAGDAWHPEYRFADELGPLEHLAQSEATDSVFSMYLIREDRSGLARIHRCRFEAGDFSGAVTSALSGHVGTSGP